MRALILLPGLILFVLSTACAPTEPHFVEGNFTNPRATVTSDTLGLRVTGSFGLTFTLGSAATGRSAVDDRAFGFTMYNVADLRVTTTPPFPVTVEPGSDVDLAATFDTGPTPLKVDTTKLCDPAGVRIRFAFLDPLISDSKMASEFASAPFHPAGCP